ncbi:MAG TPA: TIGR02391 family protein [Terriglobia bacterium]|nr:TIGR02391 family protein [Terriglobia bacterium]
MPRKSYPAKEAVPPTMSPHQAIPLLQRQIARLGEITKLSFNDPAVDAWESATLNLLNAVYGLPNGEPHSNTRDVKYADSGESLYMNMSDAAIQRDFVLRQQKRKALLLSYIEQLQDLAPPAAAVAGDQYRLQPEIERVSGQLYRDGHYKQAALEAYIRVIDEVKGRSGLNLDGDSLMNRAFGSENQTPVIQFNSLQTDAERDEQKGFMFLFKGIVGLRNSKAHSNRLFNDPYRAHDYLALASLLMRVLEVSTVNRP